MIQHMAIQHMAKLQHNVLPTMQGSANYQIRVRGSPDASWSERLGGMQVAEFQRLDGDMETTLVGRHREQHDSENNLKTPMISLPIVCQRRRHE